MYSESYQLLCSFHSPSEDRLFTSGWKDDSYFFGDSESYVTRPVTLRERMLLRQSEEGLRGHCFPRDDAFEAPEDDEDYKFIQFDRTEEGLFLPNPAPTPLLSLPMYLKNAGIKSHVSPDLYLLERRKRERLNQTTELLSNFVFADLPARTRMFSSGVVREVDPLLSNADTIDRNLFLEYMPILRCINALERSEEYVFSLAQASDPDAATSLSNRSRTTRRSKALGRHHYLESVVPAFVWKDGDRTPKDVGRVLAESLLVYDASQSKS